MSPRAYRMKTSLAERFWAKVNKNGPMHPVLQTQCWLWTAGLLDFGYGRFRSRVHSWDEGAHRVSWALTYGPVPDGLDVLHKCDNPPCVNPEHLFLGTQRDNNLDRDAKGRTQRYNALKTHCPQGHAYTPENTHITKLGRRHCRICHRTRQGLYNKRTRHAIP